MSEELRAYERRRIEKNIADDFETLKIQGTSLVKKDDITNEQYYKKIREKAIARVKENLVKHNKTIDDYNDDEMEDLIAKEEGSLNEDVKKSILMSLLAAASIEIAIGWIKSIKSLVYFYLQK